MPSCGGVSFHELFVQFKLRLLSAIPFISDRKKAELQTRLRKDVLLLLKSSGINHIADIPEELLSNILIRLPSKLVVRCKLVCKQWASLVSDPFFISSYISRLPPSPSSWTVVGERLRDGCIEYDQPRHMRSRQDFDALSLSINIERRPHQCLKFSGANDGMILFGLVNPSSYKCSLYYICNPAVRKLIPLSPLPPQSLAAQHLWASGLVARVENGVLESFRVVLLVPELGLLRFWVYASETQEWNEYCAAPPTFSSNIFFDRRPTALNQKLHWAAIDGSLIAYDPYGGGGGGGVRLIPPPKDERGPPNLDFYCRMCDASEGKLRCFELVVTGDVVRFKLWVLEDYESGAWPGTPHHVSDHASLKFDGGGVISRQTLSDLVPMFFDPFDPDIVYLVHRRDRGNVVSYDIKTRKVEVVVQDKDNFASGRRMFPCWHSVDLFDL